MNSNYAIKPTPEQALGANRTMTPARLIAALDFLVGTCGYGDTYLTLWVTVHVQAKSWLSFAAETLGAFMGRARWATVENAVKDELLPLVESAEFRASYPKLEEIWVVFWSDDQFKLESPALKVKRHGKEIEVGSIAFEDRFVRGLRGTRARSCFLKNCVLPSSFGLRVQWGTRKWLLGLKG